MARHPHYQEKIERAVRLSTVNQKKAFIFAFGWFLRQKHGFKKYPEAYNAAKGNIGLKSLVFGVPQWPKKYEKGPLQSQMRMFYKLMEQSLENDEYRVNYLTEQLILYTSYYYHKHVSIETGEMLWWDTNPEQPVTKPKAPYTRDSVALACKVWDSEDFGLSLAILCDSLEESGHEFEMDHLRTGIHTPACPVLRQIAGIK